MIQELSAHIFVTTKDQQLQSWIFLNILLNQAKLAAQAWFDSRFKNLLLKYLSELKINSYKSR